MQKERLKVCINVHLILVKGEEILFSLRHNTGYEDGHYSLVAGHLEPGETLAGAMVREAKEEIGLTLNEKDLKAVHSMHRKTDRDNLDVFFLCENWSGTIENHEPDKCGDLSFYPLKQPPENIVAYIEFALRNIAKGNHYSEYGW